MIPNRAVVLVSALLLAGAGAQAEAQSAPAPARDSVTNAAAPEKPRRWQGSFRATRQNTAGAPGFLSKVSGSFSLAEDQPGHLTVQLSLSTRFPESRALQWAIVPGQCRSKMAPLTSIEQFPQLDVSPNGSGRLDITMPLTIPSTGQFSLNIYLGGTSYYDIFACGNLSQAR